jgi:hypothetical protein
VIQIDVDIGKFPENIDQFMENIVQFGKTDMPEELTDWQTQDMRRKYPNTEQGSPQDYRFWTLTKIWPTSRLNMLRTQWRPSRRPILREELLTKLCDRMREKMARVIQWP